MKSIRNAIGVPLLKLLCQWTGKIWPGLSAWFVYRYWFASPRYPASKREENWLQSATQVTRSINGKNIVLYRWDSGSPDYVLFLHGWSGRAGQLGGFAQAIKSSGFDAIGLDLPGHGMSDGTATNIYEMTEVINGIVQDFGVPKAIVTHSFGGMAAAMAIRRFDLPVDKLIMISCPMDTTYLIAGYQNYLGFDDKVKACFEDKLYKNFSEHFYAETSVEENLKLHPLTALIVHDRDDKIVSWKQSDKVHRNIEGSEALFTRYLGHSRVLRDKTVITKVVEFIKA